MKSFKLIYDNGKAVIVLNNPDFEVTELCGANGLFQDEINRLRSELDAIAADAHGKFTEFALCPRSDSP